MASKKRVTDETILLALNIVQREGGTHGDAAKKVGLSEQHFSIRVGALGLAGAHGGPRPGPRHEQHVRPPVRAAIWPEGFLTLLQEAWGNFDEPAEFLRRIGQLVRQWHADRAGAQWTTEQRYQEALDRDLDDLEAEIQNNY